MPFIKGKYIANDDDRSRSWCLTINNWKEEDLEKLKNKVKYKYIIVGDEVGENGTPHLQVYFHLNSQAYFKTIKNKFPTAHIEPALGNDVDNKIYCSKQNKIYEDGEISVQGQRNDIEEVKDIIFSGGNMRDVVKVAKSVQSVRMAEIQLKYFEPARNWIPHVSWYWGATGCGKTKKAFEEMPNAYVAMETATWWEGYDGHEDVIIDDMRKNFCTYSRLLVLLGEYACRVECKGGSRQFVAKRIIITSCYPPEMMYDTREDLEQLLGRIDVIEHFSGKNWRKENKKNIVV